MASTGQRHRENFTYLRWMPANAKESSNSTTSSMGMASATVAALAHRLRRTTRRQHASHRGRRAQQAGPEVIPMKSTTSARTISKLRAIFGQHGIPEMIVSDNDPQFASDEFAEFAKATAFATSKAHFTIQRPTDSPNVWRAVCFKIPERHSFKAPEPQSSEAPKRQSSRGSTTNPELQSAIRSFFTIFSRWWIRTSCLVVYRYHHMAAAVDLHVAGNVFFSDFTEDEDLPGLGHAFKFATGASHQYTVAADLALLPIFASSLPKAVKALCLQYPHVRFSSEYHLRMGFHRSSYAALRERVTRAVRKGDYFGCLESRPACTPVLGLWSVQVIARSLSPKYRLLCSYASS